MMKKIVLLIFTVILFINLNAQYSANVGSKASALDGFTFTTTLSASDTLETYPVFLGEKNTGIWIYQFSGEMTSVSGTIGIELTPQWRPFDGATWRTAGTVQTLSSSALYFTFQDTLLVGGEVRLYGISGGTAQSSKHKFNLRATKK